MIPERFLPLLAAAMIAVAVTILSTGDPLRPFSSTNDGRLDVDTDDQVAAPPADSAAGEGASLRVHPLLPASLRPGGARQLLLQISGSAPVDMDDAALLEVTFAVVPSRAGVWIQPDHQVLPRGSLQRTRFEIGLHADVACDADLGDLHVTIRHLTEDGAEGEATVALPPVVCAEPPPPSPESVHITDPVCGDDWREELEALKDGDELDPERCTEERWGQEVGSAAGRPPARGTPRVEAPDEAVPEETEAPPEEPEAPPEEPEAPPEEPEAPPVEPEEPTAEPETPSDEVEETTEVPAEAPGEPPAEDPDEGPGEPPAEDPDEGDEEGDGTEGDERTEG